MSAEERERRLDRFYRPYHDAVGAMIASVAAGVRQRAVHLVGAFLHAGHAGPCPALACRRAVGHATTARARPLIDMLAADPTLVVGDNEPYDGALRGDTMYRHAIVNGFAHALIEIRQDLIADEAGARRLGRAAGADR